MIGLVGRVNIVDFRGEKDILEANEVLMAKKDKGDYRRFF
jgi:hypothetical protein